MDEASFLASPRRDLQVKVVVPPELSLADRATFEVVLQVVRLNQWQDWQPGSSQCAFGLEQGRRTVPWHGWLLDRGGSLKGRLEPRTVRRRPGSALHGPGRRVGQQPPVSALIQAVCTLAGAQPLQPVPGRLCWIVVQRGVQRLAGPNQPRWLQG